MGKDRDELYPISSEERACSCPRVLGQGELEERRGADSVVFQQSEGKQGVRG